MLYSLLGQPRLKVDMRRKTQDVNDFDLPFSANSRIEDKREEEIHKAPDRTWLLKTQTIESGFSQEAQKNLEAMMLGNTRKNYDLNSSKPTANSETFKSNSSPNEEEGPIPNKPLIPAAPANNQAIFSCESSFYEPNPIYCFDDNLMGILNLEISLGAPFDKYFSIQINSSYSVKHLIRHVKKEVDNIPYDENIVVEEYEFKHMNETLDLDKPLREVIKDPSFTRIDVLFHIKKVKKASPVKPVIPTVDESMLPFSSSGSLNISIPTYPQLARMTVSELQAVTGFTVENQDGSLKFEGPLNVVGLDVDQLVSISKANIEIVSKDIFADRYGFNQNLIFSYYTMDFNPTVSIEEMRVKVLKRLYEIQAEYLDFEPAKQYLKFRTNCNTVY